MLNKFEHLKKLVKKYDRRAPRYTSYPTVPVWSNEYQAENYVKALVESSRLSDEPVSIYIHIPFCRTRCWYCGCNTTVGCKLDKIDLYLEMVERESEIVLSHLSERTKVSQLHWGGGTPTFLDLNQMDRLYKVIDDRFNIIDNSEVSIELDPRITTNDKIDLLKSLGFNRLSFGIQDFSPEVQKAIGRNQDEKRTVELYEYCRKSGFDRINFDLIYGLPNQNRTNFEKTISRTIELNPNRIALYSFAYLPDHMKHQSNIDADKLPGQDDKFSLFLTALEMFSKAGYVQIGMDHFVLPEDELAIAASNGKLRRNFMGYTINTASDWIGLGMSAISFINNNFTQNISRLNKYIDSLQSNKLATYRGMKLSEDDLIRQRIISELMCNFKLEFKEVESLFQIDFKKYFQDELKKLRLFLDDQLIEMDKDRVIINPIGKIFVRNIATVFDTYLKKEKNTTTKFSKTI